MFKETKMKKSLLLMGLLSVLLMAGMMFTACSMGNDDDGGLSVPAPGDLPALPSGVDYVSTEAEAKTLLAELTQGFWTIENTVMDQVRDLIEDNETETETETEYSYTWNVQDGIAGGLKINTWGTETYKTNNANFMSDDYSPKEGDYDEESESSDTAVEFTADKTAGEVIVYEGSRITVRDVDSYRMTITKLTTPTSGTVNFTGSENYSLAYGLTASVGGRGVKIILDAQAQGSINKDLTVSNGDFDWPDTPLSYSGSLQVYGADDTPVYTKNIKTKADYDEVMGYFDYYR
jgi:hypothetical protein